MAPPAHIYNFKHAFRSCDTWWAGSRSRRHYLKTLTLTHALMHMRREELRDLLGRLEVSLFGSSDFSPKLKLDSMCATLLQRLTEVQNKYALFSAMDKNEDGEVYMRVVYMKCARACMAGLRTAFVRQCTLSTFTRISRMYFWLALNSCAPVTWLDPTSFGRMHTIYTRAFGVQSNSGP